MAFDPQAYLAGGAPQAEGASGFDPRAYISGSPAIPGKEPGTLEAVGRGALQGATLGFSDEIAGAVGGISNALMGKKFGEGYRAERDESRASNKAAEEAHPIAYGAGEVGGGVATAFVPGLNVAKGASLGAHVAQGAAYGAAAGLGSSEADLTKGDLAGAARDTAVGAALGGVTGAASKGLEHLAAKAPERQVEKFLVEAGDGATVKMRDKIAQAGGKVERFVEDNPAEARSLMKAAKDPEVLVPRIQEALDSRAAKLDAIYKTADKTTGGIPVARIQATLDGLKGTLSSAPHEAGERLSALEKLISNVDTSWGAPGRNSAARTVPTQDVRALVSDLQKAAYSRSVVAAERPAQETAREASKALRSVIEDHVQQWAPHHVDELAKLNGEVSSLAQLQAAAEYRALRGPHAPKNRLAAIAEKVSDNASLAASFATHNPLPYLAKKAAIPAAQKIAGGADAAYAALVRAAQNGSRPAAIIRQAAENGLPRALAEKVIASFSKGQISP